MEDHAFGDMERTTDMRSKVVFSGIQPTGSIHIGNFFGAIKQWVAGQDDAENIFCLVDMHALTVPQDPAVLSAQIMETATLLLAWADELALPVSDQEIVRLVGFNAATEAKVTESSSS